MNRQMRRASEANGRRMQIMPWEVFKDVTTEAIERHRLLSPGSKFIVDRVYQNPKYIVQCFYGRDIFGKPATKAMIRRSDGAAIYSWSDMFRIKNEIFGDEAEAVQMFPKKSELVDEANLYWLWVIEGES